MLKLMLDFVRYFLTSKNHLISSTFKSPSPSRAPAARSTTTRPKHISEHSCFYSRS